MKASEKYKIIICCILLFILSLLDMYGSTFMSSLFKNAFKRQIIFIIIGIISFLVIYKIDFKFLIKKSFYFYIFGIFTLILVLFIGRRVNGAASWFKFGSISIEPSEIFKPFYIIYLSKIIVSSKKYTFIKALILTLIPSILIFLEPDTGVVIMYLVILSGLIINSNLKKRGLIISCGVLLILVVFTLSIYYTNKHLFVSLFGSSMFYRIERVLDYKNNTSYQLSKALIGIGSSGYFGHGLTSSKVYIPEATTDFVYDLTICNFGILGGVITLIIFIYLLYNIYRLGLKEKNKYKKVMISGVFYLICYSVFEHILMNLGITPITGITLPLLSYGGSSLVSICMLIGLITKKTTHNSSYS